MLPSLRVLVNQLMRIQFLSVLELGADAVDEVPPRERLFNRVGSTAQGGPPELLGDGMPTALSPSLKSTVVLYPWGMQPSASSQLRLLPIGPGIPQDVTSDSLSHIWAAWFPDGKKLVFVEVHDVDKQVTISRRNIEDFKISVQFRCNSKA